MKIAYFMGMAIDKIVVSCLGSQMIGTLNPINSAIVKFHCTFSEIICTKNPKPKSNTSILFPYPHILNIQGKKIHKYKIP